MASAAKVKPDILSGNTAQGCYVIAADGAAFGWNNNRSTQRLISFAESGLTAFQKHTVSPLKFTSAELDEDYGRRPKEATASLRIFRRIRPLPIGVDASNSNVARDHLWISKSEIEELVRTDSFPRRVIGRFARFGFTDNVRGEPDHWKAGEVSVAEFATKKLIEASGKITYSLVGRFKMEAPGVRGLELTLNGRIVADRSQLDIDEFRAYGEGMAWGKSTYTPNPPPGTFPIVFAVVEAKDEMGRVVPPQAIFYGSQYYDPTF